MYHTSFVYDSSLAGGWWYKEVNDMKTCPQNEWLKELCCKNLLCKKKIIEQFSRPGESPLEN